MEQHHSPEPAHACVPNPTPDLTAFQAQIDPYLDRICLPLARTLTADEVAEQRAEMRTHLEALYTGYLETGSSVTEAARLSLDQFGRARRIQHDWQIECETTQFNSKKSAFRPAFRFAVRSFVGALLMHWLVSGCLGTYLFFHPEYLVAWFLLTVLILPLFPFGAGIRIGWKVRYRPILVSFASALVTSLLVPTIYTGLEIIHILATPHPVGPGDGTTQQWLADTWNWWPVIAVPVLIVMPVIGMAGALLGQLCRCVQQRWIVSRA